MGTFKGSSINKVFSDYGVPRFWEEYTRNRGRFDKTNEISFPCICACMKIIFLFVKIITICEASVSFLISDDQQSDD